MGVRSSESQNRVQVGRVLSSGDKPTGSALAFLQVGGCVIFALGKPQKEEIASRGLRGSSGSAMCRDLRDGRHMFYLQLTVSLVS